MNAFIRFTTKPSEKFCLVEFELVRDLRADDLKIIQPPDAVKNNFSHKGVILSGRGPVWLYAYLTHFYHATKFIAIYEPRLRGAIVIESHSEVYKIGDFIQQQEFDAR